MKISVQALGEDGSRMLFKIEDERTSDQLNNTITKGFIDDENLKILTTDGVEIIITPKTKCRFNFSDL